MIKFSGTFYENDYYRYIYDMDKTSPANMERTAAVVLAIDVSQKPLMRNLSALEIETATDEEIDAHLARFKDINPKTPDPLPLQIFDGEPAVLRTAKNVAASGVGAVVVAAPFHVFNDVAAAVPNDVATVTLYDEDAISELDAKGDGQQMELVSPGMLLWAKSILPKGDWDSVMFVHADQVTFEPRHFQRLRTVFEEDASVDFVSSFVEWRTGIPILFSLDFAKRLPALMQARLPKPQGATQRSCRLYRSRHALMGEDKLFGTNTPIMGARVQGAMPKSALTTVQAARRVPSDYEVRRAKAMAMPADPHVAAAKDFLAAIDASLEASPIEGLAEADAWARINRADFPLLNTRENAGLAYLDAAATSLQPSSVIHACHEFATHYDSNIWRGNYANAGYSTMSYQAAREKVAAFINADPRDVIFTINTTTSLNMVAQSWARHNLKAGDLTLVMCNEHHSNMIPWQRAAQVTGGEAAFIPVTLDGRVDMEAYARLLERKPRLVCAAQVSNVIGLENPIREMAAMAHKAGAVFVMDAAQSSPHFAIDVQELGIDFLAMSGHKLQAPTGIGVLWAHPDRVREMVPEIIGGGTISEVSYEGTYFRQAPYAFEPGTPPIEQAIGLGAAIDYLQRLGMDKVEQHVRAMTRYALRVASQIPEIQIIGNHADADGEMGVLSYTFDTLEGSQISGLLGMMGVAVRSGAHCAVQLALALGIPGSARISFGPYTTKADIEAWGYGMKVLRDISRGEIPRS